MTREGVIKMVYRAVARVWVLLAVLVALRPTEVWAQDPAGGERGLLEFARSETLRSETLEALEVIEAGPLHELAGELESVGALGSEAPSVRIRAALWLGIATFDLHPHSVTRLEAVATTDPIPAVREAACWAYWRQTLRLPGEGSWPVDDPGWVDEMNWLALSSRIEWQVRQDRRQRGYDPSRGGRGPRESMVDLLIIAGWERRARSIDHEYWHEQELDQGTGETP